MTKRNKRSPARTREPKHDKSPAQVELPRLNRWIVLALIVATVLAYVPALRAPFVLDDAPTIDASSHWISPEGSPTSGRPLVMATLAANFALNSALGVDQRPDPDGTDKAIGYRIFNLLLHLLTGALLFGVVRRAMRERTIPPEWRAVADPLATVVCALWLLHPIQSEVINYIVQRSESQASLCYLAVLYASQRAWEGTPSSRLRWYALAVAACMLGMASKEIVISAPLAVMLYDRAFRLPSWPAVLKPGNGRGWLYLALWLASLASFAAFEAGARGQTAGFNEHLMWYEYLYSQCWAIAHYLRLVVWPAGLTVDYGINAVRDWRAIPGLVLLALFGIATLVAWTRVPRWGWFAFLGSMFFILLAPSSSVVPIASEIAAERRIYLALAAVLVLLVVATEWARRRFAADLSQRKLGTAFAALAAVLAIATAGRSHTYASVEALWRSAVAAVPDNPRALGNLGWALFKSPVPKLAEAESVYARAMAVDSTCHFGCLQYAAVLTSAGRIADAVPLLESATAADQGNALAERALGIDLMKLGDYARAIPHLEFVASRFPEMDHLVVLGVAYLSAGRVADAVTEFRQVSRLDGGSAAMQRLSARLEDGTRHPEALPDLQKFAWQLSKSWI
ncbi:MAG: tetratricopeptide repeat protein [Thermoplasmata archaeon]